MLTIFHLKFNRKFEMDMVIHQCQQLWSDCTYLYKGPQEESPELEDVEEEGEEE